MDKCIGGEKRSVERLRWRCSRYADICGSEDGADVPGGDEMTYILAAPDASFDIGSLAL